MPSTTDNRSRSSVATRRRFLALGAACGLSGVANATESIPFGQSEAFRFAAPVPNVVEEVIPKAGVPTGIVFGDSIQKLIAAGVIDTKKFRGTKKDLPRWVERVLEAPSDDPILFSEQTALDLVDLLWPVGLANKAAFNDNSPLNTPFIPGFASTGGWNASRAENAYIYFNNVEAVRLSESKTPWCWTSHLKLFGRVATTRRSIRTAITAPLSSAFSNSPRRKGRRGWACTASP